MATYFAQSTANINAANVWNTAVNGSGSYLTWPPASGDVLVANNKTITVNVDTNLGATGQVRNDTTGGATDGGGFTLSSGVTLTANVYAGDTGTRCVGAASGTSTVTGNVYGGSGTNSDGVSITSSASITINGDVTGGSGTTCYGLRAANTSTVTINGNVIGGSVAGNTGVYFNSLGTLTVTGNVSCTVTEGIRNNTGGTVNLNGTVTGGLSTANCVYNVVGGVMKITGNVIGGSASGAYGVNNGGTGNTNITGNVTGGSINTAQAVRNSFTGTVTLTGNAIGDIGPGVVNTVGGTASISGYVQASLSSPGATNSLQGILRVGETRSASNGRGAVTGAFRYISTTALIAKPYDTTGPLTMKPVGAFTLPAEADVRQGVAFGADKTGTLAGSNRHTRMAG